MRIIVINFYTDEQYEEKEMTSYEAACDYVFTKYNAVYDIKREEGQATYYVYNKLPEGFEEVYYGMRLRGYSLGCQPSGVKRVFKSDEKKEMEESVGAKYHDIITYDHELTEKETEHYSLDRLGYRCIVK
jgi:hypothetical protein